MSDLGGQPPIRQYQSASGEDRLRYYEALRGHNLSPLWEKLHALVPKVPATSAVAALWDYDGVVREQVFRAGDLVTAEEAERRVLILENPGLPGAASLTQSLYAGVQLVKPGEVAAAHRHAQSALRFVIEGRGAYTAVDGEKILMGPGDLILTPSWRWHDHGNDSGQPIVWLDGLDIPLVSFFSSGFAETGSRKTQEEIRPVGDSAARYGNNMFPVDWRPRDRASPVISYPYARSRETLETLLRNDAPDPCHGHKVRFVNPSTGGAPMPTISAFIQLLPSGFSSVPYRSTDATIFTVVEGQGETVIGGHSFRWKPRDIFVAPSWHTIIHRCESEATIFSFSDRTVQETLGIWREERNDGAFA